MSMSGKLMHAVWYDSYGGGSAGLKHVEVPAPTPSKDEVLLKIEAASLNPVDWKTQEGMFRPLLPRKFPHLPGKFDGLSVRINCWDVVSKQLGAGGHLLDIHHHGDKVGANQHAADFKKQSKYGFMYKDLFVGTVTDAAGEVLEVGPEVKNFKVGDKIVAMLNPTGGGGLAEYAVAKQSLTVLRPPEVPAADGAALVVAALTAHQALSSVRIKLDGSGPRMNILITAASGGVGHYAVQLAKLGNTHVTATCGARNLDLVKSLGADEVLDYKTPEGASLKSPSGQKYDAVIHCASSTPWSAFEPNLSPTGKVIDVTPVLSTFWTYALKKLTFSKKQLLPMILTPKSENMDYLVKLAKEGKLKTVIDSKYPLSKAEDAWAKSIDGHATGKIIVEP
ncbi:LOW QUALITY PROTEIN: hypothetical protein RJ639_006422 [Escallonia herrerae]|uniref:Enoyl reductase (ER) domain-containing protein n=1 Tax=Escallonia herrerae TaxID=1293975 RepID=A0AA88VYF2_9ASTE|nr:LOW QUALITY PROTEIN: hypothetical protein RJ639_006422 [Escallonia herrerae]